MSEYNDYGYNDNLPTYAHSYLLKPILQHLNKQKNKMILDLGCGNGALVNKLITYEYNAYGTDASEQGIQLAKKINPVHFYVQDLSSNDLPSELQDKRYDTIISTEVIEHLYDPKGFIRFAKRILEKNGHGELILSTPYNGYLKNIALSLTNSWDKHLNPLWDGGHIKFWSKKTLTKALEDEGFKVTKFIGCGRVPYLWKSMLIIAKLN